LSLKKEANTCPSAEITKFHDTKLPGYSTLSQSFDDPRPLIASRSLSSKK
jgi:hypothetical protein